MVNLNQYFHYATGAINTKTTNITGIPTLKNIMMLIPSHPSQVPLQLPRSGRTADGIPDARSPLFSLFTLFVFLLSYIPTSFGLVFIQGFLGCLITAPPPTEGCWYLDSDPGCLGPNCLCFFFAVYTRIPLWVRTLRSWILTKTWKFRS